MLLFPKNSRSCATQEACTGPTSYHDNISCSRHPTLLLKISGNGRNNIQQMKKKKASKKTYQNLIRTVRVCGLSHRHSFVPHFQFSCRETLVHRDKAKNPCPSPALQGYVCSWERWDVDISHSRFATVEEARLQTSVSLRWKLSSIALPWQEAWRPYLGFILRLWQMEGWRGGKVCRMHIQSWQRGHKLEIPDLRTDRSLELTGQPAKSTWQVPGQWI